MKKTVSNYFRLKICLLIVFTLSSCRVIGLEDTVIINADEVLEISSKVELTEPVDNDSDHENDSVQNNETNHSKNGKGGAAGFGPRRKRNSGCDCCWRSE